MTDDVGAAEADEGDVVDRGEDLPEVVPVDLERAPFGIAQVEVDDQLRAVAMNGVSLILKNGTRITLVNVDGVRQPLVEASQSIAEFLRVPIVQTRDTRAHPGSSK